MAILGSMPSPRSPLSRLFTVLLAGLLAGLVLALAALPTGLLGGFVAKASLGAYAELPDALRTPAQPQRSYLYANDGKTLITTFYDVNRTDVPLAEIAPVMRQAIISAEDRRFYSHGGADLRGIARALVANVKGGGTEQGGSTLTMQYVRNVLKTDPTRTAEERQAATEQTVGRKLQEIRYANALEQSLSKDEILNRYLNIAYFGSGAYGVAAASQRYFGTAPADLTLGEAALLAGLVQSPDEYSPIDGDKDAALARRAYVLDSMAETGAVTAVQAAAAKAEPLRLRPTAQPNGCTATAQGHDDWGFFCDYLRQWWLTQPAFGDTADEREQALRRGGYRVVTTLDPKVQQTAQAQATKVYGYDDKRALPIAAVEPGTGRVLAMAVNRHYSLADNPDGQANHPNTVNPLISGGGERGRLPGRLDVQAVHHAGRAGGRQAARHRLRRAGQAAHPVRLRRRGQLRRHVVPEQRQPGVDGRLPDDVGRLRPLRQHVLRLAGRAGRRGQGGGDGAAPGHHVPGRLRRRVRPERRRQLGRVHARRGRHHPARPGQRVRDGGRRGHVLHAAAGGLGHRARRRRGGRGTAELQEGARTRRGAGGHRRSPLPVGQQSAYGQCNGGTATGVDGIVDRPVAGKTGSSERNATETFVGFTPQVAVAGIAANPDDATDLVGSAVQAKVIDAVARTIKAAVAGKPVKDFTAPSRELAGDPQRPQPRPQPTQPRPDTRDNLPADILRWLQNRN